MAALFCEMVFRYWKRFLVVYDIREWYNLVILTLEKHKPTTLFTYTMEIILKVEIDQWMNLRCIIRCRNEKRCFNFLEDTFFG